MSDYRHGAYADQEASRDYTSPSGAGTVPVYIGRAPVHQLTDYSGTKNVPLQLSSWQDAAGKIGYSDNWEKYDLCEAVYAHFRNDVNSVGPIIVINVLNPDTHRAAEQQTAAVAFVKNTATISSPDVILKTVAIDGKTLGTDFTVKYADDGLSVVLTDLTGTLGSDVSVSYYAADPDAVTEEEVAAGISAGVPLVYYNLSELPAILCSPGWSSKATVFAALVGMLDKINGHWYSWLNADLDSSANKTVDAAITAKEALSGLTGAGALLWPMAKKGNRMYHLSTMNTVTMQQVDLQNGNIPFESPSNKQIDADSMCLADGSAIQFDQTEANQLNAAGIDTATYWEGTWRMWGPHTMKYVFGSEMDARDVFDANSRMTRYVMNNFQRQYGAEVDKPMIRSRKDSILNDFQAWLDGLVQEGALLYGGISFTEDDNPTGDLIDGNFVFETEATNPVPGKSITSRVRWTSSGLTSLFGGDDNG